ncbi:MAG: hypothetical protein QW666_00925 [Candidatus Woesearchaeota archaeon]
MGAIRLIIVLVLLLLNFIGAIFLETRMTQYFHLELVLMILGFILMAGILLGLVFEARWAWPLSTIFFAASLANAVFLYFNVKSFLVFSGLLFFNLIGLVLSVVSIKEEDDFSEETADSTPAEVVENEEPKSVVYKSDSEEAAPKKKKKK